MTPRDKTITDRARRYRAKLRAEGGTKLDILLGAQDLAQFRARCQVGEAQAACARRLLTRGDVPTPPAPPGEGALGAAIADLLGGWRAKLAGRSGARVKEVLALVADLEVLVGEAADRP